MTDDVVDRVIAGEPVRELTPEDVADVQAWVDDPRNGVGSTMRRLITLLIYEIRKVRSQP